MNREAAYTLSLTEPTVHIPKPKREVEQLALFSVQRTMPPGKLTTTRAQADDNGPLFTEGPSPSTLFGPPQAMPACDSEQD